MTEVMGVVALLAQLSTTCINIIEFTHRVKADPCVLGHYRTQLEHVRNLCSDISNNPLLHTTETAAVVRSLIKSVETNNIRTLLDQKRLRFLPFSRSSSRDDKISSACASLTAEVSLLSPLVSRSQVPNSSDFWTVGDEMDTPTNIVKSQDTVLEGVRKQFYGQFTPTFMVIPAGLQLPTDNHGAGQLVSLARAPQRDEPGAAPTVKPSETPVTRELQEQVRLSSQVPEQEEMLKHLDTAIEMSTKTSASLTAVGNTSDMGGTQYIGRTAFISGDGAEDKERGRENDEAKIVCAGSVNAGGLQYIGRTVIQGGQPTAVPPFEGKDIMIANKSTGGIVGNRYQSGTQFIGSTRRCS